MTTVDNATNQKKGIGELGPLWITAISGLIVALTGTGFFVGRASSPEASSPPATHTVTVTTPAPQTNGSNPNTVPDHVGSAMVEWEGELIWGSYNLDFNPPREVPGKSFQPLGSTLFTEGEPAGTLADWQKDSVPNKDECEAAVTERGSQQTNSLVSDSYVCGRTSEGRVFRIHVVVAGEVQSQVTVWASDTP